MSDTDSLPIPTSPEFVPTSNPFHDLISKIPKKYAYIATVILCFILLLPLVSSTYANFK